MEHFPGEGQVRCAGFTNRGTPCSNNEIEGLEYCLHHIPDDLLEEAEQVTGWRRCRTRFGEADACRFYAVTGTEPPACKNHGANPGSVTSREAGARVISLRITTAEAEQLVSNWERITSAPPVTQPLEVLQQIAGEALVFKDIIGQQLFALKAEQWRYRGRAGEQVRAEIIVFERAVDRVATICTNLHKLDLAAQKLKLNEREVAVSERQIAIMERAFNVALQASGATLEGQEEARKVLKRELMKAA
jgi:Potential DNA-binding domain